MPRRRRSANTIASTPEQALASNAKKKKQKHDDDEVSLMETILSRNQYSTGGTAVNDSDLGDFGADEPNPTQSTHRSPVKSKMPPLVVKHIPQEKLAAKIAALGIEAEYKLTRIGTKIHLHTKADYIMVQALLKDSSAEYFTHDIPGEKPFKAVIRGLPDIDPKKIAVEIKDRFKLAPSAVYRMVRRDETTKKYPDSLFLVHFPRRSVTLNALKAIRSLFSIIIKWEAYRGGHRDVTQCQRCLHFGHGTRNCFVNARCGICADSHATTSCPSAGAAAEAAVTFKCANCGGAHQATDKQCGKREEFKRIRKAASTTKQPGRKAAPTLRPEDFPPLISCHPNRQMAPAPPPASNPWFHQRAPPTTEAQQNPPPRASTGESLLTDEELVFLVTEVLTIKQTCRTRTEQLRAVTSLIARYGG